MLRGRREYGAFLSFILFFALLSNRVTAKELQITAYVPLSGYWQSRIIQNSQISFDAISRRNIIFLSFQLKPIEETSFVDQTVQVLLFKNNSLLAIQEKTGGIVQKNEYSFFYNEPGEYRFIIINKTYEQPFVLKHIILYL